MKRNLLKGLLRLSGETNHCLQQLVMGQWLPPEQLRALQRERLARLLLHAYRHVPWYREVLARAGVVTKGGNDVRLESFDEVAVLSKADIRAHGHRLRSDHSIRRRWRENTSGGSTGEPVTFVQDQHYRAWNRAVKILDDLWTGASFGDRKVLLWGSERDLWVGRETLKTYAKRWLRNEIWLNTFRMTRADARNYIEAINRFRPRLILAYVESIDDIASIIHREGLFIHSPAAVMTTGGTLYPEVRGTIERTFRACVFNRYGSREVGDVACECDRHVGLHVSPLTHYVEVLNEEGRHTEPEEEGEIVVTLLTNFAMPLIRYRIGDTGAWAENLCGCGRPWPLLRRVTGRTIDIFRTRNGTRVHGQYFIHLLYFREWLAKFRVIQESFDRICVLLVSRTKVQDPLQVFSRDLTDITRKVQIVMGPDCKVDFAFVDDIPPSPSGKYLYTVSKVAERLDLADNINHQGSQVC